MKKSPALHIVGMLTWLVTGLAALNVGLGPWGFDFFKTGFMMERPAFATVLCYIVLISALASLAMFLCACRKCTSKKCDNGDCSSGT